MPLARIDVMMEFHCVSTAPLRCISVANFHIEILFTSRVLCKWQEGVFNGFFNIGGQFYKFQNRAQLIYRHQYFTRDAHYPFLKLNRDLVYLSVCLVSSGGELCKYV